MASGGHFQFIQIMNPEIHDDFRR
jgi:hypothetical protein